MGTEEARYRVILVDDEPRIIRSLKVAIPWEDMSLQIAGEAGNGEGALALIKDTRPQIIISDIRMPGMDGISLMKEVLHDDSQPLFIFISGYGEFEYAREALREGAFDYLLKPIDHEELATTVTRAVEVLRKQEDNDKLLHSVQVLSMLARERMLTELIEGNCSPLQHMQWLEHSELDQGYYMAVVQLDQYIKLVGQWSMEERRLWLFAVRNILEEWSMHSGGLTVFPFRNGEWVLLFPASMREQQERLGREVISLIKDNTKLSASIGFSQSAAGMNRLAELYESASGALYQRFYAGPEGVYFDLDSEARKTREFKYPKYLEAAMLESIRTLDAGKMQKHLDQLKDYLEHHSISRDTAERMIAQLIVVLYRQFEHWNILKESALQQLFRELDASATLKDVMSVLQAHVTRWLEECSPGYQQKENAVSLIGKALTYISEHYHYDLSMEEAAETAGLSISHFCVLFKQVTGFTFLEYVTNCRVEKAKILLHSTSIKVYQIAGLVGYQDPKYFTQVFKKVTGQTPSEYREGCMVEESGSFG